MIELGVVLDTVALLRETRNAKIPDPVFAAFLAEQAGAAAVNVQLRGDRAHIQERDVEQLRATVTGELNLVVTPRQEMARLALTAKPERVTFIPERLETAGGGGLDVLLNSTQLKERVREMRESTILPAIFLDPSIEQVKAAHQVGVLAVEISTETYVSASDSIAMARDKEAVTRELQRLSDCTRLGAKLGLHVGLGHGLTLRNTPPLLGLGGVARINVGHSLVSRAVMVGMERATTEWMDLLSRPVDRGN
jgi:pyridoxine 5-phosphate synthase